MRFTMRSRDDALVREREEGFSLIEVLISLTILSMALMSLASFTVSFVHMSGTSYARSRARALAVEMLEEIRREPFEQIQSIGATEVPGTEGYLREVVVREVGGPTGVRHFKIVSVEVEPPGGLPPVKLSSAVSET